jgi:hypothetical protein
LLITAAIALIVDIVVVVVLLFTTNLDARLGQNAVSTFCACFASDFIFLTVVFLLGLAPWGIPFLPFISAFKGFGTGLTAAYLIITYSLKGAGFICLLCCREHFCSVWHS